MNGVDDGGSRLSDTIVWVRIWLKDGEQGLGHESFERLGGDFHFVIPFTMK